MKCVKVQAAAVLHAPSQSWKLNNSVNLLLQARPPPPLPPPWNLFQPPAPLETGILSQNWFQQAHDVLWPVTVASAASLWHYRSTLRCSSSMLAMPASKFPPCFSLSLLSWLSTMNTAPGFYSMGSRNWLRTILDSSSFPFPPSLSLPVILSFLLSILHTHTLLHDSCILTVNLPWFATSGFSSMKICRFWILGSWFLDISCVCQFQQAKPWGSVEKADHMCREGWGIATQVRPTYRTKEWITTDMDQETKHSN